MSSKHLILATLAIITIVVLGMSSVINNSPDKEQTAALDIIVIAGQSNAEYMDDRCDIEVLREEYREKPEHNLYYFGTIFRPICYWMSSEWDESSWNTYSIFPMWNNNRWAIGGYEPVLANEFSKKSGNDVIVLNVGVGGKKVSDFVPGNPEGDYGFQIIDMAYKMMGSKYGQINSCFWLWIQGEADYATSCESYIEEFNKVKGKFESYGFNECYIVHTREKWGANANIPQEIIAQNNPNVSIIVRTTENLTHSGGYLLVEPELNGIHYSEKGRIYIAKEIIKELKTFDKRYISFI